MAKDFDRGPAADLKDIAMPSAFEKYSKVNDPGIRATPPRHLSAHFPAATYREWLAALDPIEPISLYLHVPFCKQMCWYCGCNMKLAARYSPVATYVRHLLAEIDLIADALPALMPVSHTPLRRRHTDGAESDDLAAIMARLLSAFRCCPMRKLPLRAIHARLPMR